MRESAGALIEAVTSALQSAIPGSAVARRGSRANGTADAYSDLDLEWTIPGDRFVAAIETAADLLRGVRPIESYRVDPDDRGSFSRRLLFVRFAELPIYWRLDLECLASGAVTEADRRRLGDLDMPWSDVESALMNCVAALKSGHRNRAPSEALDLLARAERRIDLAEQGDLAIRERIARICIQAARLDPQRAAFARAVLAESWT